MGKNQSYWMCYEFGRKIMEIKESFHVSGIWMSVY